MHNESVWLTEQRDPSSPLDGDSSADVVVIGGGITGLTCALLLQRNGSKVALVEGRQIGSGTTGYTTGKVTSQHGLLYDTLIRKHGEKTAGIYAQANQESIELVASLAEEAQGSDFERAAAYVYTDDAGQFDAIHKEEAAAKKLGLPAAVELDPETPFPSKIALRFDGQAHIHPYRYLSGLADAFVAAGGSLYENTQVLDVDETGNSTVVKTRAGDITADRTVIATLIPFLDIGGFFAKAYPSRAYGIAVQLESPAPPGMYITAGEPTRSTRPWSDGDQPGLIVVGETHQTGDESADPARWEALEGWTRQHYPVKEIRYRWSAQDYSSFDELPYVGRCPRTARTFVATGFRKWGLSNGTAAALILADVVLERPHPWLEAFDSTRMGDLGSAKKLVKENAHVAMRFVGDRISRFLAPALGELKEGEGKIVRFEGDAVGAYRAPDGKIRLVSVSCTHMGCTLAWNGAETSWDCPCHGSRFSTEGKVLNGPAVEDLEMIETSDDQV